MKKKNNISKYFSFARFICLLLSLLVMATKLGAKERLLVYAGAASKPPTEEAIKIYEDRTGQKIDVIFGGSGYVLSQMKLTKQGDIYFPGSSDFMEKAKQENIVFANTEKIIVYLVPAINVPKGNPKKIKTLKDLTRPGLRIAIANPEYVCVGTYAVEIMEKVFNQQEKISFKKNLVNYTESCEKTATAISLNMVDAVIGWSVFEHWDNNRIETIRIPKDQIVRIGYIPIAISKFTKNRKAAQQFIDFMSGPEGKKVFAKYHYFSTPEDAFNWLGEIRPVGGEYIVPTEWLNNAKN